MYSYTFYWLLIRVTAACPQYYRQSNMFIRNWILCVDGSNFRKTHTIKYENHWPALYAVLHSNPKTHYLYYNTCVGPSTIARIHIAAAGYISVGITSRVFSRSRSRILLKCTLVRCCTTAGFITQHQRLATFMQWFIYYSLHQTENVLRYCHALIRLAIRIIRISRLSTHRSD